MPAKPSELEGLSEGQEPLAHRFVGRWRWWHCGTAKNCTSLSLKDFVLALKEAPYKLLRGQERAIGVRNVSLVK